MPASHNNEDILPEMQQFFEHWQPPKVPVNDNVLVDGHLLLMMLPILRLQSVSLSGIPQVEHLIKREFAFWTVLAHGILQEKFLLTFRKRGEAIHLRRGTLQKPHLFAFPCGFLAKIGVHAQCVVKRGSILFLRAVFEYRGKEPRPDRFCKMGWKLLSQ